jgi:hypothetical protein
MPKRLSTLFAVSLLVSFAFAKDKTKTPLPTYVLRAQTVAVIIDPDAGFSVENPDANKTAQKDVETALLNWGRYNPILGTQAADLIIVVRKGNGRLASDTINDPRQNNRPAVINPIDNGVSAGVQHGPQPNQPGIGSGTGPSPQVEVGGTNDSFLVYEGGGDQPLDRAPVWRYVAKDGLRPHTVPAVDAFRKAVADAEKAAAKNP